jgi:prepilin-type N-terminal cleavage/methylation domain-containing protein
MHALKPGPQQQLRGFTLVEFLACVAVVTLLAAAGWPSWSQALRRHQVQAAAQHLAQSMAQARQAAVESGQNRYVVVDLLNQCQAVAQRPDCPCHQSSACLVKVGRWVHGGQIQVRAEPYYTFTPAQLQAQWPQPVVVWAPEVAPLEVQATPLGRARMCAPNGGWPQHSPCEPP